MALHFERRARVRVRGRQVSPKDDADYSLRARLVPPSHPAAADVSDVSTRYHAHDSERPLRAWQEGAQRSCATATEWDTDKGQICIDGLTSFHAGSWQPAWGVRTGRIPRSRQQGTDLTHGSHFGITFVLDTDWGRCPCGHRSSGLFEGGTETSRTTVSIATGSCSMARGG